MRAEYLFTIIGKLFVEIQLATEKIRNLEEEVEKKETKEE